jgi:hypothetical protein
MNDETTFSAPWGASLKVMTLLFILILVGIPLIGISSGPRQNIGWIVMIVMPLAILIIAAFFTIRGYILTPQALFIQRLGWKSKLDLTNLVSAEVDPTAMDKSIRTCGNGGIFCFAGTFYNKKLLFYRAFATAPRRSVVLKFPKRTVVVTPDKPDEFVEKIKKILTKRENTGI